LKYATLLVGFSDLECARYIETLKLYEKKGPDVIRGEKKNDAHEDVFADCLTTIKSVNQSDAMQLGTTFGSMKNLCSAATVEELLLCPGLGIKKAQRIVECMKTPL
jgi:DNA excision repair protein ERCC-1